MYRFADVSYFVHQKKTEDQINKSMGNAYVYVRYLEHYYSVIPILHADNCSQVTSGKYRCFGGLKLFWWLPQRTHDFIYKMNAKVVLVQGFVFPVQVLLLRLKLGSKAVIILQYHGEQPFQNPLKRWLQKLADRYVDGYFFTSLGSAAGWIRARIIKNEHKCYEVLGSSTEFTRFEKSTARKLLGINQQIVFLSVGRLNANKDPLTVLSAFEKYLTIQPSASMYMIYQTDEMLDQVMQKIMQSDSLRETVKLIGKVEHSDLRLWYSASDFYISASHREATGFALIEAMSCGCIPIVTDIPSFRKITGDGAHALLFQPGNPETLLHALTSTEKIDVEPFSAGVEEYFKHSLSFEKIAEDIRNICDKLIEAKISQ